MDGFTFSTPVRVRFADTDAQGIAHNSAYVVWFEVARVEYLRAFAGGYQELRDHGIEALVLESPAAIGSRPGSTTSSCPRRCVGLRARGSGTSTRSRAATSSSPTATPSTRASSGDDAPDARPGLARRGDQRGGGHSDELTTPGRAFSNSRASCRCSRSSAAPR